jgi:quercetin dioxygenase-like cupin family protein
MIKNAIGVLAMKKFPEFVTRLCNKVPNKNPDSKMEGFLFEGRDDTQIIFWQCKEGGIQEEHSHTFWEYALVVEGTFEGEVGGEKVFLRPGDECVIPPGVKHSGRYSTNYRAIDAFSAKRIDPKTLPRM